MTISDIFHLKTLENDFFFNIPGAVILSPGCSPETDLADERKKKIAMLQPNVKHILAKMLICLFQSLPIDSMIPVNKWIVTITTLEQNKKRIEPYFSSVKFIKWDEVAEPIIRFF